MVVLIRQPNPSNLGFAYVTNTCKLFLYFLMSGKGV